MGSPFPHRLYLTAALALAYGGFAMTTAIVTGDSSGTSRLLNTYIDAFWLAVVAVVGVGIYSQLRDE